MISLQRRREETLQNRERRFTALLAVVCVSLLCACRSAEGDAQAQAQIADEPSGYPPASWRYDRSSTERVVVSLAHIFIAHKDSRQGESNLWVPLDPPPTRSPEEALARAKNILRILKADPSAFASMARQYSDDRASAESGGALGCLRASSLPETFIDALATLRTGEISRVVVSSLGYHLIRRLEVPRNEALGGREILVTYRGANTGWLRDARDANRTRAAARAIADDVAGRARTAANDFPDLVQRYSDAYSAIGGGTFGPWRVHENGPYPRSIETLRGLAVGEVSQVLDEPDGFRILQRLRVDPLALNSNEIVVLHEKSQLTMDDKPVTRSRDEAQRLSRHILDLARGAPTKFDALRERYCEQQRCKRKARPWLEGRGIPGLDQVLAKLKVGELASDPVETPFGFHVVRRDEASAVSEEQGLLFEVPSATPKAADDLMARVPGEYLAAATIEMGEHALQTLELNPDEKTRFRAILANLAIALKTAPADDRPRLRSETGKEMKLLLGRERFQSFERLRDQWLKNVQLR